MPTAYRLNIDEIAADCNVDADFVRELTQRKIITPQFIDGMSRYSGQDRVKIQIAQKGLDLEFSIGEIELLISECLKLPNS